MCICVCIISHVCVCVCANEAYIHTHAKCVSAPCRGVKSPQHTLSAARSSQHSPCSLREAKMLWDYKHFLNNFADRRVTKYPCIKQLFSAYKPALHAKAAPMSVLMFPGHSSAQLPPLPPAELKAMQIPNECSACGVCGAERSQHPWSTSTKCPSGWEHPAVSLLHLPFCLLAFYGV